MRRRAIRHLRAEATAFAVLDLTRGVIAQRLRGWSSAALEDDIAFTFDLVVERNRTPMRHGPSVAGLLADAWPLSSVVPGASPAPQGEPQVPREGGPPLPVAGVSLSGGQNILMGGIPSGQATPASCRCRSRTRSPAG